MLAWGSIGRCAAGSVACLGLLLVLVLVLALGSPRADGATGVSCAGVAAHRSHPAILALDPRPRAPRVFAMQYKQEARNVVSYGSFRTKIECLLRAYVLPYLARGRPNVVVFNEDIGLATLATGSRGKLARDVFARRGAIGCEPAGAPCGALGAIGALTAAYAVPLAAYELRFPSLPSLGLGQIFVAATDTTVRSFMGTFSALAKRYRIYMIGSADLPPFRESRAAADRLSFGDPDLRPAPTSVYVASAPAAYNQVFMWGPRDVRSSGPDVMRNVVASNRKVPLTSIESALGLSPGPSGGRAAVENLRPYALPGTRARIGFATSLPAFVYGSPGRGVDPCSDTSRYYMRCLSRLGANLVIQADANPGRWTGPDGNGIEQWQPLSWMGSTYRAISDPTVRFAYNVTAMMVGNLADLAFDGQSAITARGLRSGRGARRCHYIGNGSFVPGEDQAGFRRYAGAKSGFLALAPWVLGGGSGSGPGTGPGPAPGRAAFRRVGAALAPGSGSPLEDDYLETALVADLPIPVDRGRVGCFPG